GWQGQIRAALARERVGDVHSPPLRRAEHGDNPSRFLPRLGGAARHCDRGFAFPPVHERGAPALGGGCTRHYAVYGSLHLFLGGRWMARSVRRHDILTGLGLGSWAEVETATATREAGFVCAIPGPGGPRSLGG